MASADTAQRALCRSLGKEYRIRTIDFERVIYRDFGNGFNVEISNTHTTSKKKLASLYLWFGDSLIVKRAHNVSRDDIGAVAESFYDYSQQLVADGYDNRDALFYMLHPELKKERK